jgi:hypothetical protein
VLFAQAWESEMIGVTGSSPVRGAKRKDHEYVVFFFFFSIKNEPVTS